ncbi:hypothetical protein LJ737_21805 [Hymenobacter sp. 15J16-1T3B]|uniref:hypothetical protein n=1 Tax=Hymenobacter sp. 15J16-1T3B TaxID=2886941 RepID=UPI001D1220F6|nr:hypothetical protein [Hymenobacter sp. 15J16-1T3B]MCC3159891.1 hypothetical protein [Hymenobacter sp. 15J16-1T3B]
MNRHERTLLRIGTVLLVSMAVLRISHCIDGGAALALLAFGGLFVGAALSGHNKRLKAENQALRPRPLQDRQARS